MTTQTTPPGAGIRQWMGLTVLALPTLVLALDMSVLYLAAPAMTVDLRASSTEQLWIIDIYGFMIAGFLITMGTLGDRIGRRKLLMIGGIVFALASLAAAFAPSAPILIAARALLGVAGATLMPSTLALITNMFTVPRQRTAAISIWISCFMSGMALGPVIGGLLLESFWWGSVFLLAVPVMTLMLAAAPFVLPEYRDERAGRLDLLSVGLCLATILPLVYGFKQVASHGYAPESIIALAAGAAVGVVFVRRQLTVDEPLINIRLFQNRAFTTTLLAILISTAAGGGLYLLASQYLQLVQGLSPLHAGLWISRPVSPASSEPSPHPAWQPGLVPALLLQVDSSSPSLATFSLPSHGQIPASRSSLPASHWSSSEVDPYPHSAQTSWSTRFHQRRPDQQHLCPKPAPNSESPLASRSSEV